MIPPKLLFRLALIVCQVTLLNWKIRIVETFNLEWDMRYIPQFQKLQARLAVLIEEMPEPYRSEYRNAQGLDQF